jgi:hypothetical protein
MSQGCCWLRHVSRALFLLGVMVLLAVPRAALAEPLATPIPGPPPPRRVLSPAAKQQLEAFLPSVRTKVEALMKARSSLDQAVDEYALKWMEHKKLTEESAPLDQKMNAYIRQVARELEEKLRQAKQGAAEQPQAPQAPEQKVPELSKEEEELWRTQQRRLRDLQGQVEKLRKRVLEAQQQFQQAREEAFQP